MKKVLIAAVCLAGAFSLGAQACPAGMHLTGGNGAHHKGGTCVANHAGTSHANHDAKGPKKPHTQKQPHHSKSHGPAQNHPAQQPEHPPVNGPADQAPNR